METGDATVCSTILKAINFTDISVKVHVSVASWLVTQFMIGSSRFFLVNCVTKQISSLAQKVVMSHTRN